MAVTTILSNYTVNLGNFNVSYGPSALNPASTGTLNTAMGNGALSSNTTGSGNTGYGTDTLKLNTSGNSNSAFGRRVLDANISGSNNTGMGFDALGASTADNNTGFGAFALASASSGGLNTGVGRDALSSTTTGINCSGLGAGALSTTATASNEVTLGDSNVTSLRCNVTTITSLSDKRDKTNIKPLKIGLDYILSTNPVEFVWKRRDESNFKKGEKDIGFIAQELQETQTKFNADYVDSVLSSNPERLEASYGRLLPIMAQAIKDLNAKIEKLEKNQKLTKTN